MAQIHFSRNYPGVVPKAPAIPAGGTGTTKYLREDGTWAEPPGSSGSSTLEELEDVDINIPSKGQTLVYDSTESKWKNGLPLGLSIIDGKIAQTIRRRRSD